MSAREILIALISSVVSGLAVWLIQQAYTNKRERRREEADRTIKSLNDNRVVSDDIFETLAPGRSIELMKEMLGVPDIFRRRDAPLFVDMLLLPDGEEDLAEDKLDKSIDTHSYIYMFKNAHVKITSRDNVSIDSLTVMSEDKSLSADSLLLPEGIESAGFGDLKVTSDLTDAIMYHRYIRTMKDSFFAMNAPTGPPMHQHLTFFGYSEKSNEYEETNDPKILIGAHIEGVCISANLGDVYYIYDYECR